jgi:hypothetical protein
MNLINQKIKTGTGIRRSLLAMVNDHVDATGIGITTLSKRITGDRSCLSRIGEGANFTIDTYDLIRSHLIAGRRSRVSSAGPGGARLRHASRAKPSRK